MKFSIAIIGHGSAGTLTRMARSLAASGSRGKGHIGFEGRDEMTHDAGLRIVLEILREENGACASAQVSSTPFRRCCG
jgi:hypothetical protein